MRYIYTVFIYLALPFIFLRLLWRSRRLPGARKRWSERLGFAPFQFEKSIWVHAVSVGETIAAIPLIKALKKEYPDVPLVVTNMTVTGGARVKAAFGDLVHQAYIPYDLPGAVARFVRNINPQIVVVMETEIWPNLYAELQKNHIPIVIANARLSAKSAAGYLSVLSLTKQMLAAVGHLAVQGKADAERFKELGMPAERVSVTGNIKFDLELSADLPEKTAILRDELGHDRLIWVAASTHQGEEDSILAAHKKVLDKFPSALLILVPRHPERFNSVFQEVLKNSLSVVRRSEGKTCDAETQVYFGDTMGEMMLYYSVSDVAFVAGSFITLGGHNMLEPAALGKPILTGPHLFNFAEISELLISAKGMTVVRDGNELAQEVIRLFGDESLRNAVGESAFGVVEANRGALGRQMEIIRKAYISEVRL